MSTETVLEEVQSVALEINQLELQEEPNAYASFGIFSQLVTLGSNKTQYFSLKTLQVKIY